MDFASVLGCDWNACNAMKGNPVTIIKNGQIVLIDENHLCRGDIVVLQAGDIVPADIKLIKTRGLEIDQFEITGEILPVNKSVEDEDAHIYKGSKVIRGMGKGFVVAVGEETEYGRIEKQISEQRKPREFEFIKTRHFGVIGLLLFAFLILLIGSENHVLSFLLFSLSAAIILLLQNDRLLNHFFAKGELEKLRMLKIQINDVSVINQFNDVDIMCFDKTGVLTTRRIDVTNILYLDKTLSSELPRTEYGTLDLLKIACALCNDVQFYEKIENADPIDKALISFASKNGIVFPQILSQYVRVYEQPFDSEKRYMACGFEINDQVMHFAKGDPDVIMRLCDRYMSSDGTQNKINIYFWDQMNAKLNKALQNGHKAIALAFTTGVLDEHPSKYTYLCLIQLENRLNTDAPEVIKGIMEEGKKCILLTGDSKNSAIRVGKVCGITKESELCITGGMIDRMELTEVLRQASYCSLFARLNPSQKGMLIRLFQRKGHCVAMVGDGPNDGVALKVADVGITFKDNSSPIARKLSRIMLNELSDLQKLIDAGKMVRKRIRQVGYLRYILITLVLMLVLSGVLS